jgi:O-antigen ligase
VCLAVAVRALARLPLDVVLPVLVAAMVVVTTLGSGSVSETLSLASRGRWVVLAVLLAVGVAGAAGTGRRFELRAAHVCAALLVGVSLLSAAWSVDPRLTIERGSTLAALFVAVSALAHWAAGGEGRPLRLLVGIAAGAAVVAYVGALLVLVRHSAAIQPADANNPWRLKGLGQNPNTAPMLFAIALPVLAWAGVETRRRWMRLLLAATGLVLLVEIGLSGSRGALAAVLVGGVTFALIQAGTPARRLLGVAGAFALCAVTLAVGQIPQRAAASAPISHVTASPAAAALLFPSVFGGCRQEDEIGRPRVGQRGPNFKRSIFGTSGRGQAWKTAVSEWRERPIAGYGFGTEDKVFLACSYVFQGARPENSYLGLLLQLGGVGLAVFAALGIAVALALARAPRTAALAATAGAFAASLALAVGQSYVYSVGNIATFGFWLCAFVGVALTSRREVRR